MTGLKRKAENSENESASEDDFDNLIRTSDEEDINNINESDDDDLICVDENLNKSIAKKNKDKFKISLNKKHDLSLNKDLKNKNDIKMNNDEIQKQVKKKAKGLKGKMKKAKEKCDEKTSIFMKCREFAKLDPIEFKKFFTEKGFEVKNLFKFPPLSPMAFVDLGSLESVQLAIKQFHLTKIKGNIVIASNLKPKDKIIKESIDKETNLEPITLVDRIIYLRNLPFKTTKKNIQDIFPKAETVLIPPNKGYAMKDAIMIFATRAHLENAFSSTKDCEFNGHKLILERITTVPNWHDNSINASSIKDGKKTSKLTEVRKKKLNKTK